MKTICKTAILFILMMSSCRNSVQKDFEAYDGIMRSELVNLDMDEQTLILGKMSPEQKTAIWQYKIESLLLEDRYSAEEKAELKKLAAYIKPSTYTEGGNRAFQAFAEKWERNMEEKFGWDEEKFVLATNVFMTTAELNENLRIHHPERYDFLMTGNPKIDNNIEIWAKKNKQHYDGAPRSEFVKLKINQQDALYRLMSQEKRAALWACKCESIKTSELLSQEEKTVLQKFYGLLTPEFFDIRGSKKNELNASRAVYRELLDLGWESERCSLYLDNIMTESEIKDYCRLYNLPDVLSK